MTTFQTGVLLLLGAILLLLTFAFPAAAEKLWWTLLAMAVVLIAVVTFIWLVGFLLTRVPSAFKGWLSWGWFPLLRSPAIWIRTLAYLLTIASAVWASLWLIYAFAGGSGPLEAVISGFGPPIAGWVLLLFLNDWREASRRRKGRD